MKNEQFHKLRYTNFKFKIIWKMYIFKFTDVQDNVMKETK